MDKIQQTKRSEEKAPEWFTNLLLGQEPMAMRAQNPYIGDASPSYLGPGQYGPMTEQQARIDEERQARRAAGNTPFARLMRSGKEEPAEPGFLDFLKAILQLDRIGPNK
jgi:hypothetical protein